MGTLVEGETAVVACESDRLKYFFILFWYIRFQKQTTLLYQRGTTTGNKAQRVFII